MYLFSPSMLDFTIPQKVSARWSDETFRVCVFDRFSWTCSGHTVPSETRLHLVKHNFDTTVGNMIKSSRKEWFSCPFSWWPLYIVSWEWGVSVPPLRGILRRKLNPSTQNPKSSDTFSIYWYKENAREWITLRKLVKLGLWICLE